MRMITFITQILNLMQRLKFTMFVFVFLFSIKLIIAQNWPIIYGDDINANVSKVIETYDRGYMICGWIYKNQNLTDYGWIIKTDINGNILWDKKFGDGNYGMYFSDIKKTNDNGLIISGATGKYDNLSTFDAAFYKLNYCGESEWCQVLRSPDDNYGTGIIQLNDGSYLGLLQYFGGDIQNIRISLVKMDHSGEPLWIQNLAQEDSLIFNEEGDYLYLTNDQNYLISGQCFHPGLRPFWIKADTLGSQIFDLIWQGGIGTAYESIESENNYFYSVGSFAATNMPFTPSLYKFDNDGNPLNKTYILGDTIEGGEARSICSFLNSNILVGMIWGTDSDPAIYKSEIFLLDTMGNILNRKLLLNEEHAPESIIKTFDNKIIVSV